MDSLDWENLPLHPWWRLICPGTAPQPFRIWSNSFCLLTWSTFLLDVRILFHCTFILMILPFTAFSTRLSTWNFSCPGEMLSLRRHLEDFGLLYFNWVHGWLETCVRNLFAGSLPDPVMRFSPTAECRNCVSSTCCAIFGTLKKTFPLVVFARR